MRSFVPTKGGFGPVDLEELGDWVYSVSGSSGASEGGDAALQFIAEQPVEELRAAPLEQQENSKESGRWQLQVVL